MASQAGLMGPGPAGDVLAALRALSVGIDRYRFALAAHPQLGVPDVLTLTYLFHEEPVRTSAIGVRTGLTSGSVTALLDRLESRALVRRVRLPDNRRVVLIELTDSGRELGRGIFDPLMGQLSDIVTDPGSPEPAWLSRFLGRITQVLEGLAATTGPRPWSAEES